MLSKHAAVVAVVVVLLVEIRLLQVMRLLGMGLSLGPRRVALMDGSTLGVGCRRVRMGLAGPCPVDQEIVRLVSCCVVSSVVVEAGGAHTRRRPLAQHLMLLVQVVLLEIGQGQHALAAAEAA